MRCMITAVLFVGALFALPRTVAAEENVLKVSTDFPGGAARVVELDQQDRTIRFEPPEFPQGGLRSWWYFRLEGIKPGETITLELLTGKARAVRAVYSLDQRTWRFTSPAERST